MKVFITVLILVSSLGYSQNTIDINGCGPTSSSLISSISPNGPFPLSNTIFETSCNIHDLCYEPEGKAQATCDSDFLENLLTACEIYSGFNKSYCDWYAHNMYSAVDNFGENSVEFDLLSLFVNEQLKTVENVATILPQSLSSEIYNAGILGDEVKICGTVKNIAKFNSHFKLFLFAADKRELGELPANDFQLAWQPLLYKDYFALRTDEEKDFCLDTGGIIGIARNLSNLEGEYRLELWVNSSREDVGFKLTDFIEGKLAK